MRRAGAASLPCGCPTHSFRFFTNPGDFPIAGKILLVEDDRAIVQSLLRLLAREDYFVRAVSSGEDAVAHLLLDPAYDMALLDVALPGMDGFACCRALREQGWKRPILMLTGRSSGADKITGLFLWGG